RDQRHVDRREQRAQAERRRGRTHAAFGQRRGGAQFRRQGRGDFEGGGPARRRDDEDRRREIERAAGGAHQQEPGVRERGQPRDRPGVQGTRAQGFHLHPDHEGQQRADRAANERGERDRDRRRQPTPKGLADEPHRGDRDDRRSRQSFDQGIARNR